VLKTIVAESVSKVYVIFSGSVGHQMDKGGIEPANDNTLVGWL
jgi:hypothetical protein